MWGVHWIDITIVLSYFVGALAIGKYLSHSVKGQTDFYLAGRKLGKVFQFFLNFGQMTDSSGATSTSSVVYSNGVSGVWLSFQMLFLTPYYWFMNVWFRRVRLVTVADLFEDRFGGRFLSSFYALFILFTSILGIAWGNLVACKTIEPIMVKPVSAYSEQENQMVANYREYIELQKLKAGGELPASKSKQYEYLTSLYQKGKLKSYVSYVNPVVFYIISGLVVTLYIILGGLAAAAVVDALQAVLTIAFSTLLIPFGLSRLGGLTGLHSKVPDYMFSLVGPDNGTSEYTWFSVLAIFIVTLLTVHSLPGNMGTCGSAKNEMAARFGAVTGGFGKRFVIMAWTFCALIAVGLYGKAISDPDTTWGVLSRDLLPVGAIGLMIAGILAAKMASLGGLSITLSALFVRNLYMPLVPGKAETHYVLVGRIVIAGILALGIIFAMFMTGVISILKVLLSVGVTFGAPVLLMFFWRRLTKAAVIAAVLGYIIIIILIPWLVPASSVLRQSPALTIKTIEHTAQIEVRADLEDVRSGRAEKVGQKICKNCTIEPASMFFEGVAHAIPDDLKSPLEGVGRFNVEIYILHLLGADVRSMRPATLLAGRFLVDSILPFIFLFVVSAITKPGDPARAERFYARLKTPVGGTLEDDAIEVQKSYNDPGRFDHLKLFKNSNWEMCKWTSEDIIGFILCVLVSIGILALFWFMVNVGKSSF